MRTFSCEVCGVEKTSRRRTARFCSRRCANTASARRGQDHPSFNGGLSFNHVLGRWVIYGRDGAQMYFYRAVMAAHLGRLLEPHELVHHINGDPTDDRIENLALTTRAEHIREHMADLIAGRS